jgi:hypothetical protein
MKALTICQPYAEMICLPETHPEHKRVENRTWYTRYRGTLYIHAGKSRQWLTSTVDDQLFEIDEPTGLYVDDMAFGAVVAIARLVDCLAVDPILRGAYDEKYPWLRAHKHVNGPYCWVLDQVKRIEPIPYKGAQGLWDYPVLLTA